MNLNQLNKIPLRQSHSKGFTLLEMIIVLMLIVVLMAWGLPNYQNLKARRMVTDFSNEIVYSLTQARAEAVRYGSNVTVAPKTNWQNGWTVTANGVDGAADNLIEDHDAVDNKMTISQIGLLNGPLVFNRTGGLEGGVIGQFELRNNHVTDARRIINVNLSGMARVVVP